MEELEKNELKEKPSIFSKAVKFIGKVTSKKNLKKIDAIKKTSKFEEFLNQINKDDELYPVVEKVAHLCDDAIVIAREKLVIADKLYVLDEEIKEIECYEKLTNEDIEEFKELLSRFISLTKDRNALRYQMTGFDKGLEKMERLEKDAKFIVDNTHDAERQQRFFKHDLAYLEGEKKDLEYQRENLINSQEFLYKLSIALVIIFAFITTILVFLHIFRGANVFFVTAIMCILVIIITSSIYVFKRYIKRELKLNIRKQHRAVELINKKRVVYAHYTNFLNYVYKKYNVRNSEKLRQNIKDYSNYKHVTTRFDAIRDMLYETESSIDNFLRAKGITNTAITTERFAKTVNIDDKRKYYSELTTQKEKLEVRLKELDEKHESIWNNLILLNEDDNKASDIIDNIIQKYIDEVGRLVSLKEENKGSQEEDILGEDQDDNIDKKENYDYNSDIT